MGDLRYFVKYFPSGLFFEKIPGDGDDLPPDIEEIPAVFVFMEEGVNCQPFPPLGFTLLHSGSHFLIEIHSALLSELEYINFLWDQ